MNIAYNLLRPKPLTTAANAKSKSLPKPLLGESEVEATSIGAAFRLLWRHPLTLLVRRWHWKAACLSACIRGSLFFIATLQAGLIAALSALGVEAALYAVISGFYGALIQNFRGVQPAWQASLLLMVALPACNHALEFTVHRLNGTPQLGRGMLLSSLFSVLSACFNLFAMRRGVLLIGSERRTLREDLCALPLVIWQFITAVPRALAMAAGLPLVAPKAGGVLSYANHENACLAEPRALTFAQAVQAVFNRSAQRAARIAQARQRAAQFDWAQVTARFFDLYEHLHLQFRQQPQRKLSPSALVCHPSETP